MLIINTRTRFLSWVVLKLMNSTHLSYIESDTQVSKGDGVAMYGLFPKKLVSKYIKKF